MNRFNPQPSPADMRHSGGSTPHNMRSALNAALVAMALRDPDPIERAAKLAILKKDSWL